jgi:hypothetical protein
MAIKNVCAAAFTALAIVGAAAVPASARGFGHGGGFHGGFHGGGFGGRGFGIGAGIATGVALAAYGYGYGYPGYAYNGYEDGGCWIQHRVVYRYGHRVVVPVQACG